MTSPNLPERTISRPEFIAILAALMSLNALAIDIMLPALPDMGAALGAVTENDRQFVIGAYMLGLGAVQLIIGPLSDRFGRRVPLLIGMAVYFFAATAAAFATDFNTLLILRFIQGLGGGTSRVITQALVRDRYSGRAMAEIMSLTFMVFLAIPIIAPGIGQLLLAVGPWEMIFLFMSALTVVFAIWTYLRLPETLAPEKRRPLRLSVIAQGFALVLTNRSALFYGLAGMFMLGALMGFVTTAQQVYVDVYGLGVWFPLAFAATAMAMGVASLLNARIVGRFGMRRLSHGAMIGLIAISVVWVALSASGVLPFWGYVLCLGIAKFCYGLASPNMNTLSMEPLGAVAGTASSVFGFIQSIGGAIIGTFIGQMFNGTPTPTAAGYLTMGVLALGCILIAERGQLFRPGSRD